MSFFPPFSLRRSPTHHPPASTTVSGNSTSSSHRTHFYISEPLRNSFLHVSSGLPVVPPPPPPAPVAPGAAVSQPRPVHLTSSLSSDACTVVVLPSSPASTSMKRAWITKLKRIFVKRKSADLIDEKEEDDEEFVRKQGSFLRRYLRTAAGPGKKTTPSLAGYVKKQQEPPPLPQRNNNDLLDEPASPDTRSIATTLTGHTYSAEQEAIQLMQKIEQLLNEI